MGLIGYVLRKDGYPIPPIVLGLILGGMFEENFRRAVKLAGGNYFTFFTKPICLLFMALSIASIAYSVTLRRRERRAT
jgi:putative tricarboxylic transport membrane protein